MRGALGPVSSSAAVHTVFSRALGLDPGLVKPSESHLCLLCADVLGDLFFTLQPLLFLFISSFEKKNQATLTLPG